MSEAKLLPSGGSQTSDGILLKLDSAHHRLVEALGKDKMKHPTIYSEAAAEIRRLVAELEKQTT